MTWNREIRARGFTVLHGMEFQVIFLLHLAQRMGLSARLHGRAGRARVGSSSRWTSRRPGPTTVHTVGGRATVLRSGAGAHSRRLRTAGGGGRARVSRGARG